MTPEALARDVALRNFLSVETLTRRCRLNANVDPTVSLAALKEQLMGKIKRWLEFNWNWHGAIVGLVLLGLLACDLALFGRTVGGYIGVAVIVLVSGVVLRFEIGPRWLHR
jgi:hypothetical protein